MRPLLKSQNPSSFFMVILTCTFASSVLTTLLGMTRSAVSGVSIDFVRNLFVFVFLCLLLFIPVYLGVIILRGFLRYQLRKGWLTSKIGILSGIGAWGLAGIGFCLFWIVLAWFYPSHKPPKSLDWFNLYDSLTTIPLLLNFLPELAIACLVGGWAGHVLSKQILLAQKSTLVEQEPRS